MPIRLFVGDQDFGLRHIAKHFGGLNAGDISELIENIFSKPNKICCRIDEGKIKLEVFSKPPRHLGILELRKNDDCYSIVSVYSRNNQYSEAKGELIWEYDSQAVLLQAANSKPRQITSGTMPQEAREELATQTIDNIDPLGINVNASNNKNPEKSGLARHSIIPDGAMDKSDGNGALFTLNSTRQHICTTRVNIFTRNGIIVVKSIDRFTGCFKIGDNFRIRSFGQF